MTAPGRAHEVALLQRAARAAAAGEGSAVLVEGPAGAGKSFLVDTAARSSELLVLRGRAWEEGGAPPYWPWREVARAGGWAFDPDEAADAFALCEQVFADLRRVAVAQPVMVVLDDLHAADDDSLRLTRYLARVVTELPALLVAAARPSPRLEQLDALRLSLPPLDDDAAAAVVDLWSDGRLAPELRRMVVAQAEGNPLHLRELARLAQRGDIDVVPDTLRATVRHRLASLDQATRVVLESAAVLGRDFDVRDLAATVGRPAADLLPDLDAAHAEGLVGCAGGTRWRFTHQLLRDGAYESLPAARRAQLHALVADAVGEAPDRTAERARHLLDAVPVVDPGLAVAAARAAAREALDAGAVADAVSVLTRALPLVPPRHRLSSLLELGDLQMQAGCVADAHHSFDAAVDLARRTTDLGGLVAAALGRTGRLTTELGVSEFLPLLGEALGAAEAAGRDADAVRVRSRRSVLLSTLERPAAARADAEAAVAAARGCDDPAVLAEALTALHMACWEAGHEQQAARVSEELVVVSRQAADDDRLLEALLARLVDALKAADPEAVDAALHEVVELADRTGRPRHRYFADSRRAMREFLGGRLATGEMLAAQAYDLGRRIEEPDAFQVYTGSRLMFLAQLVHPDDLVDQAHELEPAIRALAPSLVSLVWLAADQLDRARAVLREVPPDPVGPLASAPVLTLALRAQVAAAVGDTEYASVLEPLLRPHAGRVLVNAGAVTFCGVVDHYLGMLLTCLDRPDAARRDLLAAREVYERLGAVLFLSRVDLALAKLDDSPRAVTAAAAVLRRADDGWEVGFAGATAILPDLRGLQHLSALLRARGQDVHASDLVSPGTGAMAAAHVREVVLDERAKAEYRARVGQLQEALERVEDEEREAALRRELQAVLAELRSATGLGGRDRTLPSPAERARVAVRKAVSAAIDRVAAHDPAFAHLLRTTVRTGAVCSYRPDPNVPVTWSL